jgi:hypothetical protein
MSIDVHKDTPEPGQARVIGGAGQEGLERQQAQVYQVLQKHLDGNGVIVQMSDDVSMQEMAHQVGAGLRKNLIVAGDGVRACGWDWGHGVEG